MSHLPLSLLFAAIALALFAAMLLFMELGRRLGLRQIRKNGASARAGIGVIDGAIFAVLSLLIGFSFNGAASRFDHRRELVIKEAGMIRTAWQRVELLEEHQRHAVKDPFRRYVDALLASYAVPPGSEEELRERAAEDAARDDLWAQVAAATVLPEGEKARVMLIPSVNLMFEVVHEERLAQQLHPPVVVFVVLAIASLTAALFGGYKLANEPGRNWIPLLGVATVLSMTSWLIVELESPRLGVIRVDPMDQAIAEVRAEMD